MTTQPLLFGHVLWSYDQEVADRDVFHEIGAHFSGVKPFHRHAGDILLFEDRIVILGDEDVEIHLVNILQVALGFDEIFPPSLARNLGLFWQPLRLTLKDELRLYLIIDYTMVGTKNQAWFNGLQEILSV